MNAPFGLIGFPLGHSFSAEIHARFGRYAYELVPLPPEELAPFLRAKAFCGINVTIPYKKAVIPFLDARSPRARAIGADNTGGETTTSPILNEVFTIDPRARNN